MSLPFVQPHGTAALKFKSENSCMVAEPGSPKASSEVRGVPGLPKN